MNGRYMKKVSPILGRSSFPHVCCLAAAILGSASALHAEFYAVTDLGTLGGTNSMAYSINNHEQIVGASQAGMGNYHGFMFQDGRMMDLGTMGGSNSWAYGINDNGWMVGASQMSNTSMHGFLCTNALTGRSMMDLGTLGGSNSAAWMINMRGDMVGWGSMSNGSHHAFFMTNGPAFHMMDMGTVGGTNSEAYCVNSNRMMVGFASMADGSDEPIMSTNGMYGSSSMMTMGMGGMGGVGGESWFVNNMGNTAGTAEMPGGNHHAMVSGSGGMMGRMNVDLGTLGGTNSTAYCINSTGSVVGDAQMTNGTMHAFMVTNALGGMAHMMDVNGMIPTNSGWELMQARAINEMGQIVGWGMHNGHTNAFLMTPVAGMTEMVSEPMPQVVGPGATVMLGVEMMASEPLSYQWMHDGAVMPGATNANLNLSAMSSGMAGRYTVVARNSVGTVGTASAALCMFTMTVTNGTPLLMVAAPTGSHFRIDRSEAVGPAADWQTMTNLAMAGPVDTAMDRTSGATRARYYRAVMMP